MELYTRHRPSPLYTSTIHPYGLSYIPIRLQPLYEITIHQYGWSYNTCYRLPPLYATIIDPFLAVWLYNPYRLLPTIHPYGLSYIPITIDCRELTLHLCHYRLLPLYLPTIHPYGQSYISITDYCPFIYPPYTHMA